MGWFGSAKRIDEVRDKIFVFGAGADGLFVIFDDDFVVGDLDNFGAGNSELGVHEGFDEWAVDDELLNAEIIICDGKIYDFAKFRAFFGLDFEADQRKIQFHDFIDADDVGRLNKLVRRVNHHAVFRIFANRFDV